MAKDMTTYPVAKAKSPEVYFGDADAGQIARSKGKIILFDADKASKLKVQAAVNAEKGKVAAEDAHNDAVKKASGADASAVKKEPTKNK